MSDKPPPIGSVWRSASGRMHVVEATRIAPVAGWHVWVKGRSTPFRKKEWEEKGMAYVSAKKGEW